MTEVEPITIILSINSVLSDQFFSVIFYSVDPITERDKKVHAFSKGINPKENSVAWLKFKLAYNDVAVQHAGYYAKGIPPHFWLTKRNNCTFQIFWRQFASLRLFLTIKYHQILHFIFSKFDLQELIRSDFSFSPRCCFPKWTFDHNIGID